MPAHGRTGRGWLLLCVWLLVALPVQAGAPVWQLQNSDVPVYLAGSIHLLSDSDSFLPSALDRAYRKTEVLVLETRLDAAAQNTLQRLAREHGWYRDGTTLQDHLSPAVYARLQRWCEARDIPWAPLQGMRPWLLTTSLSVMLLQQQGARAEHGVDQVLARRARDDGRPIRGLESAAAQIRALVAMESIGADALVGDFLAEAEVIPEAMERIVAAWRRGDMATLDRLLMAESRQRYPRLYEQLLVRRNRAWVPVIQQYIAEERPTLIVVGAAHLGGPDNLRALLAEAGYRFAPVPAAVKTESTGR